MFAVIPKNISTFFLGQNILKQRDAFYAFQEGVIYFKLPGVCSEFTVIIFLLLLGTVVNFC